MGKGRLRYSVGGPIKGRKIFDSIRLVGVELDDTLSATWSRLVWLLAQMNGLGT